MTPDELRAQFPSALHCVHLNHAGTSPVPLSAQSAVQTVFADLMGPDSFDAYKNHLKRQENLRGKLAGMMNVAPATLGFVRNTSHGLSLAAQSIPFAPGDTVVLVDGEYPSNVYPWMAQAYRGVHVHLVPACENGWVDEDDLIAACEKTQARVLAVPWVHWGTGQKLDLVKLGAFCQSAGVLLVADVVQGFGALQLDLTALPIAIAAGGCHKWLLAPGGLGFVYVRPGLFPDLLPVSIGWNSVENPIDWDNYHFDQLRQTPERWEEGTPALLATAALLASIDLLCAMGREAVESRVLEIAHTARKDLNSAGYRVISPTAPEKASGIVAFRHAHLPNDAVLASLTEHKVRAAVRGGNVRVSPHAYSNHADLDTLFAALPK